MSISRKAFFKMMATGGVSAMLGWAGGLPRSWRKGGVNLVTVERQSLVMGSVASFKVVAESERDGYQAIRQAVTVFRKMDRIFSMYRTDSEMAKLDQQSGGQPVQLSVDALKLLQKSKQMYHKTDGNFDITIEPAMRRWGFRKDDQLAINRPSDMQLKTLQRLIGSDKLIIENGSALLKNCGMAVDTGGIAGGYAMDKAIEAMKKCNIRAAFINFSGDMHCFGEYPKGGGWPVQIFNPRTGETLSDQIELYDEALSTSGSYQNRRENQNGDSWGHLFQPDIASPTEPLSSFTAIHASALFADAWSTAAYVGAIPPSDLKKVLIN